VRADFREQLHVKHGIDAATSTPQEIVSRMRQTEDARDYQLTVRDVANIRRDIEFETFMLHKEDSKSLQETVCVEACSD
jgi:hypothetical protein